MSVGLKSVKKWIKRCDRDCKVRQGGVQSVIRITKIKEITNCDGTMDVLIRLSGQNNVVSK